MAVLDRYNLADLVKQRAGLQALLMLPSGGFVLGHE